MQRGRTSSGFTIVELLIVIVVIAILAAITVTAYNGVQNRANDTAVQADLRNFTTQAITKLQTQAISAYPGGSDGSLNSIRFSFNKNVYPNDAGVLYCANSARTLFVIYGFSKSGTSYYRVSDGRTGTTTTAINDYATLCSAFTGSTSAIDARYGVSDGVWRSWAI